MTEISKGYEPKNVEDKWYRFWEENNFFRADATSKKPPFAIVIPPPNVTGVLHMGHALVDTLQDVLIRWKRMCGFEALWVPGTDHAGIATQTVVERHLMAKFGKRRKEFTRETFLEHVWKWKEESERQILSQIKRLGCSCDWSRLCFTMDATRSRAVKTMFQKMFDDGLIYRGDYLVNWDPATQTALADDEVEHEDREGFLYFLRYPLEDKQSYVIIATTRPETMLGDTAIAVSPKDERYQHLIGKKVLLPLKNRLLPIIADPFVDPTFGTGVVKITPAHDPNDYELGQRHHLPLINIMTPDGKINQEGAPFTGLSMQEAREAVLSALKSLNLIEKIIPHHHRMGVSYRSKADIQPYLSKQWFVRTSAFKDQMRLAVSEGRVKLIPPHWEATYFHWIDNLRDWCISRQLWWGHRIPIWYQKQDPSQMICFSGEGVPPEVAKHPEQWVQDEDVLDTWFSSALWPFSVFGWPDNTPDLQRFYPTSTLITGHDILFFWVARMILMGEYALGKAPFAETFLHGLIYAKSYWNYTPEGSLTYITGSERLNYDLGTPIPSTVQHKWEKMSKSKGNIIDPLEIIDSYGADAMRMALCASTTSGARQIDLDRRRFEEFKNFANKVWNGARFVLMHISSLPQERLTQGLDMQLLTLEDRWILSLLNRIIEQTNEHLSNYAFDRAATSAYEFFWKEFCAYYVELCKPYLLGKIGTPALKENKQLLLLIILCNSIRLLHPLAPFITEELFQLLKEMLRPVAPTEEIDPYTRETLQALSSPACIVAPYPQVINPQDINLEIEQRFSLIDQLLHAVRNIRAEMQLPPNIATALFISSLPHLPELKLVQDNVTILTSLVRIEQVHFETGETSVTTGFSAHALVGNLKLTIPLPEEMRAKEKLRLTKERDKLILQENQLQAQLSNPEFVQKAPAPLVEKLKAHLAQTAQMLAEVVKKLGEYT